VARFAALATALAGLALVAPAAGARTIYVTSNAGGCGSAGTTVSAVDSATGSVKSIPGFSGPASIAITPDGKRAYIGQATSNIAVLDTATNSIIKSIPVGGAPCDMAISPDGSRLYVMGTSPLAMAVIDTATNTALAPVIVGTGAHSVGILPDNTKAYVGRGSGPGSITVFKLPEQSMAGDIVLGPFTAPRDVTIAPDGLHAYTANTTSAENSVTVVDTATDAEVAGSPILVGGFALAIAAAPDGKRLYVASGAGGFNKLIAVDVATGAEITSGGLPVSTPGGLYDVAVMPDGSSVFGAGPSGLYQVSTATNSIVGTPVSLPASPHALAIVPDQAPVASFSVAAAAPGTPTKFNGGASSDPDGSVARYDWDFGDGQAAPNGGPTPAHAYKTAGAYTARLTVTDNEGASTARVFTGQALLRNGGPSATTTKAVDTLPAISALGITNKSFAVAARKKAKLKRGSAFRYKLSESAAVKFTIERKTSGRKSGKKCSKKTKKNRSKKKCTLFKGAGSLSAAGKAGKNKTRFSGKVKSKKLKPGAYRATAVATDSAKGRSAAKTVSFKIVRP
jgi:YVTN family beta-propeller protein